MNTFTDSALQPAIQKAIAEMGFITPTPIQEKVIPEILNDNRNIIALAQTGTGKTAAFGLPLLQKISDSTKAIQVLVLCPTRELCMQITRDLNDFSKYMDNIYVLPVYGGARIETQIQALKKTNQIVVGTPGRTLDLIHRKALKIDKIQWLVLDEADEMLNMGFREDLDDILSTTPKSKQTLLFSATMPEGVKRIANTYMDNPLEILSGKKNSGAEKVVHHFYIVKANDRYMALKRIADMHPNIYSIVFCRTREETKTIAAQLIEDGYNADALHGDLSQAQRDQVMQRFRNNQLQLLIATDVAARGLDINDLTHVINYNLPDDPEIYVHRSGRTGRAGKTGISIIISHAREHNRIKDLERIIGKKFEHKTIPSGREICEKRLYALIDKIENIEINEEQIQSFLPLINKKLNWLDRDELLKRFVSVEFNHYLEYYRGSEDINVALETRKDRQQRSSQQQQQFSRFFLNIGTKQNLKIPNIIGLINDYTRCKDIAIGKIEMLRNMSFVEIEKQYEDKILNSFKNATYAGIPLVMELAKPKGDEDKSRDRKREYNKKESRYGNDKSYNKSDNKNKKNKYKKQYHS